MSSILRNVKVLLIMQFIILLFFVGCASNPNSTSTSQSPVAENNQIDSFIIRFTNSEFQEINTEIIPQNNCGGTAEVENIIEKSRSVSHLLEVGGEFSVNASGEVGIAGTGVELGTEVSSSLGYEYGTAEMISRSVIVKASPGANMEHTVSLQEVWELGEATVNVNSLQELIPFRFRTDFKVELVESRNLGCKLTQAENSNVADENNPLPSFTTPTQESVQNNNNWFEGSWFGTINQTSVSEYEGLFQFNEAMLGEVFGTSDYIQLECGGELTLLSISEDEIEFREQIVFGTNRCVSGLRKTIRFIDSNSINYMISPAQGYTASGTLRRQ